LILKDLEIGLRDNRTEKISAHSHGQNPYSQCQTAPPERVSDLAIP
jgi:hypothetical protein